MGRVIQFYESARARYMDDAPRPDPRHWDGIRKAYQAHETKLQAARDRAQKARNRRRVPVDGSLAK